MLSLSRVLAVPALLFALLPGCQNPLPVFPAEAASDPAARSLD